MAQRSSFDLSLTFKTVKNTIKRMSMKKFNFIYLLLAFVGVVAMTSCEHPNADYTPGAKEDNLGVYFLNTKGFTVTADATSVDIKVARLVADEAVDVSVRAAEVEDAEGNTSDLFTLPSSVSFAAGETEANYTITFDASELEVGRVYSINVQLDQTEATAYAISDYVFTITIPEPWSDWGTGLYVDAFWNVIWGVAGVDVPAGYQSEVLFQRHDEDPNRIRIVNPASMDVFGNLYGSVPGFLVFDESKDGYMEFDITDPNNVKLASNPAFLNVSANFGADGILPLVLYVVESEEVEGEYAAPIVYKDGKITFPKNNVVLGYILGGEMYGWMANSEGLLMYVTPGTVLADYSMLAEYTGMSIETDNQTAYANIDFYYASDVDTFKFTILEGNVSEVDDTVAAIVAGSEDITIYEGTTENDVASFKIKLAETGVYTIVAVPYNAEGEAQADSVYVESFYFPGLGTTGLPEVKIAVAVDSVVGITGNPGLEASYPSASSMCIYMQADGTQIKDIVARVSVGLPTDKTNEELLNQESEDYSGFIANLITDGYALAVYKGLTEGTTYDVIVGFETIYGEVKTFRTEYTPKAAVAEETPEEGEEETPEEDEEETSEEGEEETPEPSRFQVRTLTL